MSHKNCLVVAISIATLITTSCGNPASFTGNNGQNTIGEKSQDQGIYDKTPTSADAEVKTTVASKDPDEDRPIDKSAAESTPNVDPGITPNGPGNDKKPIALPEAPKKIEGLNLAWNWSCKPTIQATSTSDNENKDDNTVAYKVNGPGEHKIKNLNFGQLVSFSALGELCYKKNLPRDIVIVVDISSSMSSSDPAMTINGERTCGRLQAVQRLTESIKNNDAARIALVTFASDIEKSSTPLTDIESFKKNSLNHQNLCAAITNTNYSDALIQAEKYLKSSDAQQVSREIYFISDGEPTIGTRQEEAKVAKRLKANTVIGTIMLKGDDKIMKEVIASTDGKGLPMHAKVEDAQGLIDKLEELSTVSLASASIEIRTESKNGPIETHFPLKTDKDIFAINLPPISRELYPEGLSLSLIYTTSRGQTVAQNGKIEWED